MSEYVSVRFLFQTVTRSRMLASTSDPLVILAHRAVDEYVRHGQRFALSNADALTPKLGARLQERAGTFVSIHKKNGDLRGCIGTFMPVRANVAEEVIENAIASASRDPRFYPIQEWELDDLDISVDVLSEPEPVQSARELNPQVYGVIVTDRAGNRRGLLLPMLEQVQTVEQQIDIARQKAFIGADEPIQLFRFRVQRFH
ncbi:MAG: AmmeMemoRadiSam system protein A [Chloroflexota bacterium]|nr:MAG: AmmeMemoRadiSam system protein A [Chloroflexota bacterium]